MIEKIHPVHPHFSIVAPCRFDDALTPTELAAKTQKTVNELVSQVNKNTQTIEDIVGGHTVNEINGLEPDQEGKITIEAKDIPYDSEESVKDAIDALKDADSESVKTVNGKTPVDGAITLDSTDIAHGDSTVGYDIDVNKANIATNAQDINRLNTTKKFYFTTQTLPDRVATDSVLLRDIYGNNVHIGDWLIGSNGYVAEVQAAGANSCQVEGIGSGIVISGGGDSADVKKLLFYKGDFDGAQAGVDYGTLTDIYPNDNAMIGDYVICSTGAIGRIDAFTGPGAYTVKFSVLDAGVAGGLVSKVNGISPDSNRNVSLTAQNIPYGETTVNSILDDLKARRRLIFVDRAVGTTGSTTSTTYFSPSPIEGDVVIGTDGYIGTITNISGTTATITPEGTQISMSAQIGSLTNRIQSVENYNNTQDVKINELRDVRKRNTNSIQDLEQVGGLNDLCYECGNGILQIYCTNISLISQDLQSQLPSAILDGDGFMLTIKGTIDDFDTTYGYELDITGYSNTAGNSKTIDNVYKCLGWSTQDPTNLSFSAWKQIV